MLAELTVKNLALIDSLGLSFGAGANVMTGETGAGKSILVGALSLLMGRKGTADLVRAGADEAEVSAVFELNHADDFAPAFEALGLPFENQVILRRVLNSSGRSRCYVNGAPLPLNQLAAIGEELLSVSGQHEQQALLRPSNQLEYLDRFGHHKKHLEAARKAWQELGEAREALKALESRLKDAEEKRDLYEFQREEIKKINPKPGEDEELLAEKSQAKDSGRLLECLAAAAEILGGEPGNVVEKLGRARRLLETIAGFDERFEGGFSMVEDSYHQLSDLAMELENKGRDFNINPDRLELIDERLNVLAKLKRKYNLSLGDIIAHGARLGRILDELDGAGVDLARLRRRKDEARAKALAAAKELHLERVKSGKKLADMLVNSLRPLGFPKIEMKIQVEAPDESASPEEAERRLGAGGFDRVDFLFSPNPGEDLKPLAKIASGGELSRVMLALKTVSDRPGDQLLVFDEIDSGLGGATAEAVAAKIGALASRQQVIIITHLPQMAALRGQHFVVAKDVDAQSGRTVTSINPLPPSRRVDELARMLGGACPSPEAVALARLLLATG